MTRPRLALPASLALVALASPSAAQCWTELDLGSYAMGLAYDISADGSTVVGLVRNQFGTIDRDACAWVDDEPIRILPSLSSSDVRSIAYDVSWDGSVIVGVSQDAAGNDRPVVWNSFGAPIDLLVGAPVTQPRGYANAVSADGSTVVGRVADGFSELAFRWTQATGFEVIPLPPGTGSGQALAVSSDGQVVFGNAFPGPASCCRPFMWSSATGAVDLSPPGTTYLSELAASDDGSTVYLSTKGGWVRWRASTGHVPVQAPGPIRVTNRDGSVWGGSGLRIWSESTGPQQIFDGATFFDELNGISDDGSFSGTYRLPGSNLTRAIRWQGSAVGGSFCITPPGVPGCGGRVFLEGSDDIASGNLVLRARDLPAGVFAAFLASRGIGTAPLPGGTLTTPCLAAPVTLFDGPGQVMRASAAGEVSLQLDLAALPGAAGATPALPGATWTFQLWHRAPAAAGGSSYTDAVAVTFR